jgi:hypothetical protein
MAKQVSNEVAVLKLAQAFKDLDDANPDVGMGPSYIFFVRKAAQELGLDSADYDVGHVEDRMKAADR